MEKTNDDDYKLNLGYGISKLYTELDQLTFDDTLDDIENARICLQKQLGKMKLEKDLLDEYWADAVLQVIDYGPGIPLYVVLKMKEEERREFIVDKLPVDMSQKVHAYKKAMDESNDMKGKRHLTDISKTILKTSLELVQDGSLPDHTKNGPNRIEFLNRIADVTKGMTGSTPGRDDLKKALNKEQKKKCAWCSKPYESCFWDLDENLPALGLNDTSHVVGLCDLSCQKKFRQMPMCHKCHEDDRQYFQMKPGDGLINVQCIQQSVSFVAPFCELKRQVASGRIELKPELETARLRALDAVSDSNDSFLPNLWCVKCDVQCRPRDFRVMKPDYDELPNLFADNGKQGRA